MRYSFTQFFSWSLSRAYLGGYGGEVSLDPSSTCPNRLRYLQGSSRSAMSCHSLLRLRLQHIFNCMPAFDKYLPTFLNIYFLQHIGIANCYINVFQGYWNSGWDRNQRIAFINCVWRIAGLFFVSWERWNVNVFLSLELTCTLFKCKVWLHALFTLVWDSLGADHMPAVLTIADNYG